MERIYGDYWDNYLSVYQTANIINEEITAAVEYFTLQYATGTIQFNWLDGEASNTKMYSESTFSRDEEGAKLFQDFTGRAYAPGRDDYFETMDILCYYNDYYQLEYITGAQAHNSFCRYLVDLYGERAAFDLLIFPKTVEAATGKTWEALRSEWEQHIRDKYAHIALQ